MCQFFNFNLLNLLITHGCLLYKFPAFRGGVPDTMLCCITRNHTELVEEGQRNYPKVMSVCTNVPRYGYIDKHHVPSSIDSSTDSSCSAALACDTSISAIRLSISARERSIVSNTRISGVGGIGVSGKWDDAGIRRFCDMEDCFCQRLVTSVS